ncbi:molybdate ABC transporter substrate-binding protein [Malaciobacter pacificus]|uniref:Molybdenum ABC transporter ModABC, periplasmic molybdate-binding protein n=1 Tax=Malaciobacter pacificus TaxID=1080223 RepID=A0A5C2H477_9BACT|nr:molybdate ABC transporter substrate-binding protein [Malaciobacter pacificus]QEP33199.1 molybdenum ABC transporter ModABC, periplasmic molybdate-binding protein [Malaciobacter pacificus]GGD47669.1 molybdate ABC transporter substrate-binding protein [Malaciobacter pacificus]
MKKILILLLITCVSLFAQKINIAVAANVSYAIDDLIKEFNKTNPNTKVVVTLGSSGKLTAQIKNGAPFDVFMSANMKYPDALYKDKIAMIKPIVYAQGSLAILSYKKRDFNLGINIITDEKIKKIAIANPKTAPYGKATIEALKNANLYEKVNNKFVYGESISQTVSYAITAADLGFIAKSSLYSPKMKMFEKDINWIDVDSRLYTPINQGIVILKKAESKSGAKAFYDFILSAEAKNIFKNFGYLVNE